MADKAEVQVGLNSKTRNQDDPDWTQKADKRINNGLQVQGKWSPTFGKIFSSHKELTTLQDSLVCCYNVQLALPPVVEEISSFNIFVLQIFENAFIFSPWRIFYFLDKYTCSLLDHILDILYVLHPWLSLEILL